MEARVARLVALLAGHGALIFFILGLVFAPDASRSDAMYLGVFLIVPILGAVAAYLSLLDGGVWMKRIWEVVSAGAAAFLMLVYLIGVGLPLLMVLSTRVGE